MILIIITSAALWGMEIYRVQMVWGKIKKSLNVKK